MTKKERNRIYKQAYNSIVNNDEIYLCNCLSNNMAEFKLCMPEDFKWRKSLFSPSQNWINYIEYNYYWPQYVDGFSRRKNLRLTILALCIAMTEN